MKKTIEIKNNLGMHATVAINVTRYLVTVPNKVMIKLDGVSVDAKSVLGLLSLAGHKGNTIEVEVKGDNAEAIINKLDEIINQ